MPNEFSLTCAAVRQFLARSSHPDASAVPPPELVAHIVGCARCRGALALALGAAVGQAQAPAPIRCEECQARLAGWIDQELEAGIAAAAREDPAVWWHLWTCADCAEIYALTRALAAATTAGELAPPPLAPAATQQRQLLHSFQLSRAFLAYALPMPSAALGALRGVDGGTVLVADEDDGRRISLTVWQQPDQCWSVSVAVVPPVAGWLVLTLGEHIFRGRFDDQGRAVVADVPAPLLSDALGPDLHVAIELDEDDPSVT